LHDTHGSSIVLHTHYQPEFMPQLEQAMALLVFETEEQVAAVSPQLAALWSQAARHAVATQLNAALLSSQGQESEPRLPGLLQQLLHAESAVSVESLNDTGLGYPRFSFPALAGHRTAGGSTEQDVNDA
jgi:CTLH/CRA C-terminal to LisH motif domain